MTSGAQLLNSEFLINGSFGSLKDQDGRTIVEIQKVDAKLNTTNKQVMRAGTRGVAYKALTTTGTGTLTMFKVTSQFLKLIAQMMANDGQIQPVMTLTIRKADPESLGVEEYRLTGVKLWDINLGFDISTLDEEIITFTFEGFQPVSWIDPGPASNPLASLPGKASVPFF